MKFNNRLCLALTVLFASTSAATASAGVSDEDWIIFEDFVSGAECGVIHTSNAEFVALFDKALFERLDAMYLAGATPDDLFAVIDRARAVLMALRSLGVLPQAVIEAATFLSRFFLVCAIAAVGLQTSLSDVLTIGYKAVGLVLVESVFLLILVLIIVFL